MSSLPSYLLPPDLVEWENRLYEDMNQHQDFAFDAPKPHYRPKTWKEIAEMPHPESRGARHNIEAISAPLLTLPEVFNAKSEAHRIYVLWTLIGNLYTRERGKRSTEHARLYSAYGFGLSLGTEGMRFRDALIDAQIEYLDDYGGWFCEDGWGSLRAATQGHPDCPLRKLVALLFVVARWPSIWPQTGPMTVGDGDMLALLEKVKGEVLKDVKGRDVWREVFERGRCGFHEHGGGECGGERARL